MSAQMIVQGDCIDVFRAMRGLNAIVTDPPAGIGFMGRSWDKDRGGRAAWIAYWAERFAVGLDACKDDAVGLFWALPRTSHWTATAIEDAGWRIRDVITHHFGQGWPKDKNALKPASEAWILAVKGKPALGIDTCRVQRGAGDVSGWSKTGSKAGPNLSLSGANTERAPKPDNALGSWPTNLVLSHAESCLDELCVVGCDCGRSWLAESGGEAPRCECGLVGWWACPVAEMDRQSGQSKSASSAGTNRFGRSGGVMGAVGPMRERRPEGHDDSGGASRYFPRFTYHAKAPSGERHAGCEELFWRVNKKDPFGFVRVTREEWAALDPKDRAEGNVHPTVKRLALMRWLHALTGAKRIGDLCGGSGSGMVAAYLDGLEWFGAEICSQSIEIAHARLAWWCALDDGAKARFASNRPFASIVKKANGAT